MFNTELVVDTLRRTCVEASMLVATGIQISGELLVGTLWQDTLFVQKCDDSSVLLVDEVKHVLIVREGNKFPQNSLLFVLLLLQLEHVLIELLLQSFVGVVDANLFKVVDIERLETKDIENTNRSSSRVALNGAIFDDAGIDTFHNEIKCCTVNSFDERFASLGGFVKVELLLNNFDTSIDVLLGQGGSQSFERYPKQSSSLERGLCFVEGASLSIS
mmetsp:Transcript_27543/g.45779  ORF Transcript_27543/g.45779 Transcript_27543/m.45779 type:complete len:217 (-) Transcript_27543:365-1015(-)